MKEKIAFHVNGYVGLIVAILLALVSIVAVISKSVSGIAFGTLGLIIAFVIASSLTVIQPNEAKVLTFFGRYIGTIRDAGLFVTVPLTNKTPVSLRVRNFNSQIIKVNDQQGNPVEISAVIVYKVVDTAQALFNVEDYEHFIAVQSESAIRHVSGEYPYDSFDNPHAKTLRGNSADVSHELTVELQDRLKIAGLKIIETRINHLAYATEIASAMLQRQQASAILSARKIIVKGAVSIAESAIDELEKEGHHKLSPAHEDQMLNNLLVSIINERGTQNVINTDDIK
ncbi:SPFH domain-containing protein [Acetilactobacillus jinshanensis]|uniref:SPFH domain-containing protein n=1 Tax=Acetilactobacillus jinshanensis TaxID=1720083 RepID=A0A4P6ZMC2_9LACO|nr:SPFH domain-containing protein [Acetilactobacillus jinshanensis]QBP18763.1 SPFH domain-containing protein [Acetilactobacillus jinshanensis]URL61635.1 SPFH domain-containing protein [uncultured bacterium]